MYIEVNMGILMDEPEIVPYRNIQSNSKKLKMQMLTHHCLERLLHSIILSKQSENIISVDTFSILKTRQIIRF